MKFQLALVKSPRKVALKPVKERPPVRVRHDPPTLEEAVFAAQGLTEDQNEQAEIAATLMNVSPEQVRPLIKKAAAQKASGTRFIVSTGTGSQRTVVVERARTFRRPGAPAPLRPFGRTL